MSRDLQILPLSRAFAPALLEMWRAYQAFYEVNDIDEDQTRRHVEHILDNPSLGRIHLAHVDTLPVGFSTLYFTFTSTRACKVALLNDLFVTPSQRRTGIGRALIEQALSFARLEQIPYVRWTTQATNTEAQHLYKAYGPPTSWKTYTVDLSHPNASPRPQNRPAPGTE